MAKKKFVLRIDENTMKAVERWASDEFRSVNGQLEWIITKMLREAKRFKKIEKEEDGKEETNGEKEENIV